MTNYLIRDLNQDEKPREKMLRHGPTCLTDAELLAILLRSGGTATSAVDLARNLIKRFNNLQEVFSTSIDKLLAIKFINLAKACSIKAVEELSHRIYSANVAQLPIINKPDDVHKLLVKEIRGIEKEHLYLISLNSRNRVIAKDLISVGTVNETLISPREVFKQAFERNAVGIILAHNHPSQDASPSSDDIEVTNKINNIAQDIGLLLLDHVIFTKTAFSSLKSLNLIKEVKEGR